MQANHQLSQAIILGTKEIFASQGLDIQHSQPKLVNAGDTAGEVTVLLTFREKISGSFCFKCGLEFGNLLCNRLIGMDGTENDYELIKESVAEVLNWISGAIKRQYEQGTSIKISTPSVFVWEGEPITSQSEEKVTVINFQHKEHDFHVEIMLDEAS